MKPHIKVIQRNGVDIFVTSSMVMKEVKRGRNRLDDCSACPSDMYARAHLYPGMSPDDIRRYKERYYRKQIPLMGSCNIEKTKEWWLKNETNPHT